MAEVKKKKTMVVVLVIMAIVALLVWVFREKLGLVKTTPSGTGGSGTGGGGGANTQTNSNFYLTMGSKSEWVKLLQAYMNEFYAEKLELDGDWGPNTDAAFKRMQKKVDFLKSPNGITADEYEYIRPHRDYLLKKYF